MTPSFLGIRSWMVAAHLAHTGRLDQIAAFTLMVTVLDESRAGLGAAVTPEDDTPGSVHGLTTTSCYPPSLTGAIAAASTWELGRWSGPSGVSSRT